MELSSEEKKKIYEEEKVRLGAQEKVKKEAEHKKIKQGCLGCLGFLALIFIIVLIGNLRSCSKTEKFSFEKYIQKGKVKEYVMIDEQDISIKAMMKRFSDYTTEELEILPINIRKKYRVGVPSDITKEELKSTLAQVIKDKSLQNLDIDEIGVFAYGKVEDIKKGYLIGRAEWCPNGEWVNMTPKIAKDNNRNSYKIIYYGIK